MKIAVVFPGQGSQVANMGKDFIKEDSGIIEIISQLEKKIDTRIVQYLLGNEELKNANDKSTQISLFLVENIIFNKLKSKLNTIGVTIALFAGHSLGEYAALSTSGVLTFNDAIILIAKRAELLSNNTSEMETGMLAVKGLTAEMFYDLQSQLNIWNVFPSNINSYNQLVFSGEVNELEVLADAIRDYAVPKRIDVRAGYHSPLMKKAKEEYQEYLSSYQFSEFGSNLNKVVCNTTGELYEQYDELKKQLAEQLIKPVDWISTIEKMIDSGVTHIVEVGPNKVLSKLNKNIVNRSSKSDIKILNVSNIDDFNNTFEEILNDRNN